MLIFLDTEFTGLNQIKPDLVSIALVDESGRAFYAELPPSTYQAQLSEWTHNNVVSHLQGGKHIQRLDQIRGRLLSWITEIKDKAMIVTDCPDADFTLLKPLLLEWPKNLAKFPMMFSTWSLGDDKQTEMEKVMMSHFTPERPQHHSLNDAHALRLMMQYALESGWMPC